MKKLILTIATILSINVATHAQTNVTQVPNELAPTTNETASTSIYAPIIADLKTSGILTATNYAFEPYFTYAPKLPQHVGGGFLAIYNVNNYLGAGLGIDYLGQFSLVSGNVSIKAPLSVGKYVPSSWTFATNLYVVPFVLAGVGTPMGGAGTSVSAIADTGAYIEFGHLWGGKFNIGGTYGQWVNAGEYSGVRYHAFAGWSRGF